ncbi:flagellar protein FliS [Lachnospiraceae bacterium KH1T2]|jgi:flagellar protein FliS|nr:flagellar protein FliS [Lachnospiraceae bacterium KH1T2]
MLAQQVYERYGKNRILTATPAELTLMLYDGCLKFINMAISAVDENDVERAHNNIRKAERIIDEFQATLDHKYQVAEDFDRIYVYVKRRLVEANLKKDRDILDECAEHVRSLRDTWREVMRKAGNGSSNGRMAGEA